MNETNNFKGKDVRDLQEINIIEPHYHSGWCADFMNRHKACEDKSTNTAKGSRRLGLNQELKDYKAGIDAMDLLWLCL